MELRPCFQQQLSELRHLVMETDASRLQLIIPRSQILEVRGAAAAAVQKKGMGLARKPSHPKLLGSLVLQQQRVDPRL